MSTLAAPHLKQWIEGCEDYELCDTFVEDDDDDDHDDHNDIQIVVRDTWEGTYYQFMVAPAVMGLATLVGLGEGAYAESTWAAAMGWGGFMTYFIAVWFHEFWRGGPSEPDNVFHNYIGTSYFAFAVLGAITASAGRTTDTTKYPITFTANFGATVFGFWVVERINNLYPYHEEKVITGRFESSEKKEAAGEEAEPAAEVAQL